MDNQVYNIINDMSEYLNISQMKHLQETLVFRLNRQTDTSNSQEEIVNYEYMDMFLSAKSIEGCSVRTIKFYKATIKTLLKDIKKPIRKITTEDVRQYLIDYQSWNNCGKVTIDNIRRNLSSFFSWLEEENYVVRSPIRRIHKIKAGKRVKEIISDESIELLRDYCQNPRDLAMIDLLYSTGMRVGELVLLDRSDIDFQERECIVYGKGDKERMVYLDAKAKLHLERYLDERDDNNEALFVSLYRPHNRLEINGVETRLRELGQKVGVDHIHPHKFRRTMATRAIDKAMPIEQVQELLGHQQIDTTRRYGRVGQGYYYPLPL